MSTQRLPFLVSKRLAHIVTFWRPGSHDWTWADEYADLVSDPVTSRIRARVDAEGISFVDHTAPVLLGNDGRVWDGHHRICIALEYGIDSLMVEMAAPRRPSPPNPTDSADLRVPPFDRVSHLDVEDGERHISPVTRPATETGTTNGAADE